MTKGASIREEFDPHYDSPDGSLEQALLTLCEIVVEVVAADHSGIILLDERQNKGLVRAEYPDKGTRGRSTYLGPELLDDLAKARGPLVIEDVGPENSLNSFGQILIELNIRSVLLVPVIVESTIRGILFIGTIGSTRSFKQSDIILCESLATYVHATIERSRLFGEIKAKAEQLEALRQVSLAVTSTLDYPALLTRIIQSAVGLFEARGGGIYKYLAETDKLTIVADFNTPANIGMTLKVGEGMAGRLLQSGEQFMIVDDYERWPERVDNSEDPLKFGAVLEVPLKWQQDVIGVLYIEDEVGRQFTNADALLLQRFADHAAIALTNAERSAKEEAKSARLRRLSHATSEIFGHLGTTGLDEQLTAIARNAAEILEAEQCDVFLIRREGYLTLEASYGRPDSSLKGLELEIRSGPGCGLTSHIAFEGCTFNAHGELLRNHFASTPESLTSLSSHLTHSLLAIPLKKKLGDDVNLIGLLRVSNKKGMSGLPVSSLYFSDEDQSILEIFAQDVAVAIESSELVERLRQSREASEIVAQVTALGDLKATLDSVNRGMIQAIGCDAVVLYAFDQDRNAFIYPPAFAGVLHPESAWIGDQVPRDSLIFQMLMRDNPYIVERMSDSLLANRRFSRDEKVESCVAIPLMVAGQKVGVMFVNYRTPQRFNADKLSNIELFANQAAVAIRNAQLYDASKRQSDGLVGLYEASKGIVQASIGLDQNKILNHFLRTAVGSVTGRIEPEGVIGTISIYDSESQELVLTNVFPSELQGHHVEMLGRRMRIRDLGNARGGISGRAVTEAQVQIVQDVSQDADYFQISPETRSQLAVPLMVEGEIVGVLSIESNKLHAFDAERALTVSAFAELAMIAIKNARQYEELSRTKGLVGSRTALAWMGMTTSVWRHAIAGSAINIRNMVSLLRKRIPHNIDAQKMEDGLSSIERMAIKILDEPITPPLSSEEGIEQININELIQDRTRRVWRNEPYSSLQLGLDLQAPADVGVHASPAWIRHALDILLENAAAAVSSSSTKRITISTRETDAGIEISVDDTGHGIPPSLLRKLFLVPIKSGRSAGIGLLMAQTIVQAYGGDIRLAATGPHGTTMTISLPKEIGEGSKPQRLELHSDEKSPVEFERLYNELRRAFEELAELDRKKTEFLSNVSHELRTPLTSVQSCIENLIAGVYGPLNEKQDERLDIALASAREEARLIANLLDLARIQEGKVTLELSQGSIRKIIRDVMNVFRYDAAQRNLTLIDKLPDTDPLDAVADVGKIKQVLTNLIGNALKSTPDGGTITLEAERLNDQITIRVKDTGVGIPASEFTKIFDRFYQVDSTLTRKRGGTGIGLNIVREYVEMHGGHIQVESQIGKGSSFIFTLPLNRTEGN